METHDLPAGWEWRRLDDPQVCTLNPKKSELNGLPEDLDVTFVPMSAVDEATGSIVSPGVRKLRDVRKGYTYFSEGDVVLAKITPCMENGKSAVAKNLTNRVGFGTTEFHVLRPGSRVLAEWLHAFVRRLDFRDAARGSMCGGAGQQRVPIEFLQKTSIPVAPLRQQQRIVARIAELTRRTKEVRIIVVERELEFDLLLQAIYCQMIDGVQWCPLGEVASLVRRGVKTSPTEVYEEMGVRSFGKGTFKKPTLTGKQIGKKRIYRIHEGDLVFNNVFAWEKAIAVAGREDHGRVGSHRFITYVPREGKATSEFLWVHFLGNRGIEDIRAASPGSAGRNRTLGLKKLEKIMVPAPLFGKQERFAEIVKRRNVVRSEASMLGEEIHAFLAAILAKAFRGEL